MQVTVKSELSVRKAGENVDGTQWKDTVQLQKEEQEFFPGTRVSQEWYYSGTPLLRTPLGQLEVSLLKEVSSFQGSFCAHLYVGGTNHSVLFKVDVLISGVSL